jgi:hypothetical protein
VLQFSYEGDKGHSFSVAVDNVMSKETGASSAYEYSAGSDDQCIRNPQTGPTSKEIAPHAPVRTDQRVPLLDHGAPEAAAESKPACSGMCEVATKTWGHCFSRPPHDWRASASNDSLARSSGAVPQTLLDWHQR